MTESEKEVEFQKVRAKIDAENVPPINEFKDKKGNKWSIVLDVGMIEDIHATTGIDLDMLIKKPQDFAEFVFLTPRKFVEMLHVCLEEQIKAVPLNPREFAKVFDRPAMDRASNAFLGAVMLFYPRSSVGKVLGENLPHMIAEMDKKLVQEATEKVKVVLSNIATNSPLS